MQKTLKNVVTIEGIGLHSGCACVLKLSPAPADSGIVFLRSDISDSCDIPARFDQVGDTRNCTCLGSGETCVSTIEHLMAALYASGIDNVRIACSGRELPIMDGSGKIFYDILKKAALQEQNAPKKYLKVLKTVRVEDKNGAYAELCPSDQNGLDVHFEINFPSKIVGHQVFDGKITSDVFQEKIAPCRTFCEKYQIDYLRSLGLIKGGSLDNAVVLDGETLLNPEGFRVENECVNHKVLDALGDLFTSGYRIIGKLKACKTGHYHNNELLKELFSNKENYEIV